MKMPQGRPVQMCKRNGGVAPSVFYVNAGESVNGVVCCMTCPGGPLRLEAESRHAALPGPIRMIKHVHWTLSEQCVPVVPVLGEHSDFSCTTCDRLRKSLMKERRIGYFA